MWLRKKCKLMEPSLPMSTLDLLPQRPPFQLVDTLLQADAELTLTAFTVPGQHPLLLDGELSEAGLIENMAQSAAAGSGYVAAREQRAAPVGYIGAIKKLTIVGLPTSGQVLQTAVRPLHRLDHASIVSAECRMGGQVLASCELTIFVS